MIGWKYPPKDPCIAQYVDNYWFLERTQSDASHKFPKLNPDPAGHLIIAPVEQSFQYGSARGKGSHWLFPHSQTYKMDHSQPFQILGIKFHISALYSLAITPKQPVLDQVTEVDPEVLFGAEGFDISALLTEARDCPETGSNKLDTLLMPWLLNSFQDKHSKLSRRAVPLLADTSVSDIGELLHCSQRTLERSFVRVTGLTLKQCQSMNRLDAILEYLYQRKEEVIDWGAIAHEFGFSDQSHLIRYLKNRIGETPGTYARQRDLTIDVYGDFESS